MRLNFHKLLSYIPRLVISVILINIVLVPGATAYGGFYNGYQYRQYYRPYGHYGGYAGYHYSDHGDAVGYLILGLIGGAILTNILTNDNHNHRYYPQRATYFPERYQRSTLPATSNTVTGERDYHYGNQEGWDKLAKGDAGHALDIFAVQSQQQLHNGVPRIGFALAAAAIGDRDRGMRAMRKAVSMDPNALQNLTLNPDVFATIDFLQGEYSRAIQSDNNNTDDAFMLATLSVMKNDFATAQELMNNTDTSNSAKNLRELLEVRQPPAPTRNYH